MATVDCLALDNSRMEWKVGSFCSIYSRSKHKWLNGQIKSIIGSKTNEWLKVKYGELNNFNHCKNIQRNCKFIKPIKNNHPLLLEKNSKCKIYSHSAQKWCDGEVIDIFNDFEGEWLTIKYDKKITDIQRFSNDIKLIIDDIDNIDDEKINNIKHERRKSDSSYYLYASTDKEEAKKYKPQKVDNDKIKEIESNNNNIGSSWNNGATMETFDYSEWIKKRLKTLLLNLSFNNGLIKIKKITKIDGTATILLIRGKYKPGFDLSFKCKWKGYIDNDKKIKCNGTLKMFDIVDDDDDDEWEYHVYIDRNTKGNKSGLNIMENEKQIIIDSINVLLQEFYAKKQM